MGYTKGKPLTSGQKQSIVSIKKYFDRNKSSFAGWNDSSAQTAVKHQSSTLFESTG